MVNGGGAVMLEFSRAGLRTRLVSVNAAWNQFVHIEPVTMQLSSDVETAPPIATIARVCEHVVHNTSLVYATVRTSWREKRTFYEQEAQLAADSGVVRAQLPLGRTGKCLPCGECIGCANTATRAAAI